MTFDKNNIQYHTNSKDRDNRNNTPYYAKRRAKIESECLNASCYLYGFLYQTKFTDYEAAFMKIEKVLKKFNRLNMLVSRFKADNPNDSLLKDKEVQHFITIYQKLYNAAEANNQVKHLLSKTPYSDFSRWYTSGIIETLLDTLIDPVTQSGEYDSILEEIREFAR